MRSGAFVLVIVAGTAVASYFGAGPVLELVLGSEDQGERGGEATPEPVAVDVVRARTRTVPETTEAVGTSQALQSVEIRPDGDGRIAEIGFETGEELAAGALMVQLDDRAEDAALKRARAELAEAEGGLDRATTLEDRNVTSEAAVEAERASYLVAEAAVEAAQNAVADRRIVAPFGGTAGFSDLDLGQWVEAGEVLTTLDDLSAIEVAFALPEPYFAKVRPGRPVSATTAAYPDRTFTGEVSEVATRIDPSTRAFRVRASLANDDRALVGGLFMSVTMELGERQSVVVPETAIVREGEETYLFVVEDGTARRVVVSVGRQLGEEVEILEGLTDGQEVVTGGIQRLGDGAAVTVRRADVETPA